MEELAIESAAKVVAFAPEVIKEAVEELTGRSKRKWALLLLAFVVGSVTAVMVIRFGKRVTGTAGGPDANETATAPVSLGSEALSDDSLETSTWFRKRAQIVRFEAEMRGRVGRAGHRLQPSRASAHRE